MGWELAFPACFRQITHAPSKAMEESFLPCGYYIFNLPISLGLLSYFFFLVLHKVIPNYKPRLT